MGRQGGSRNDAALNLGTRGVDAAREPVEYSNHPGGTYLVGPPRQRHKEPFGIKLWCLGNEMDGPWQIGHKTADEYGRLAQKAAKAMRFVDPARIGGVRKLQLRACPRSGLGNRRCSTHAYEEIDYLSLHAYYQEHEGDVGSFLASAVDTDYFIESVIATADDVRAKGKHKKHINLSFDEWNVWYQRISGPASIIGLARSAATDRRHLQRGRRGGGGQLLITLLRHSDRVTAAVKHSWSMRLLRPHEPGGPSWRQTTFYPFAHAAAFALGNALLVERSGPGYKNDKFGETAFVDAVATHDDDLGELTIFAINRSRRRASRWTSGSGHFPGTGRRASGDC